MAKKPSWKQSYYKKSVLSPEYTALGHKRRLFSTYLLCTGITLVERVLDAVLEGHYFLVILQISVGEPGYSLCELLLHFGREPEHGLWLLFSNLQKVSKAYFYTFTIRVNFSVSPVIPNQHLDIKTSHLWLDHARLLWPLLWLAAQRQQSG